MAAPMEHAKLSKTERKILKKQVKSRQTLFKHDGICTSECPTKILCVSNAGLDNGVTQQEVLDVFNKHGRVTEIIMLPQKPYCFVCFSRTSDAQEAFEAVNGFLFRKGQNSSQDVYFYISYVSQVPASVAPSSEMPTGLVMLPDFVTPEWETRLLDEINWKEEANEAQRTLKHRRVTHYGYEFKYGINNVDPNDPLPDAVPESCREFLSRAMAIGVVKHYPDQLTVNQYEPGQGIPPHVDTPPAFEDGLMSLSLGSQAVMDFRHPDGRHLSVLLPRRSLLVMTGDSRYIWSHGITPRKSDIVPTPDGGLTLVNRGTRTSFTFRKLTAHAGVDVQSIKEEQRESPCLPDTEAAAVQLEHDHVHQVYDDIADHFSGTRHSTWPEIADFIHSQPTGTLLADIGCGNGKYLGVNTNIYELGSDRSVNLASICHARNFPVFVGDVLSIPLRSDTFDVCLCIAVIHHLSTLARRQRAVGELLRILRPGGQLLIYVWAMEQERKQVKSKYLKEGKTTSSGNKNTSPDGKTTTLESKTSSPDDKSSPPEGKTSPLGGKNTSPEGKTSPLGGKNTSPDDKSAPPESKTSSPDDKSAPPEGKTSPLGGKNTSPEGKTSPLGGKNTSHEGMTGPNDGNSDRNIEDNKTTADVDLCERKSQVGESCGNGCLGNSSTRHEQSVQRTWESTVSGTTEISGTDCTEAIMNHCESDVSDVSVDFSNQCSTTNKKLPVHVNRTNFKEQDLLVPWQLKNQKANSNVKTSADASTLHRFYHVFTEGELQDLCRSVGGARVVRSYYDQGNWCVVLQKS
ncbi:alkylated DNA repair protein alkB homolog 8-like [Haliotis rufescens]|uniref:alkylated DNA repair protein alkB homolog 8-like n=1 Tax=Haliotis rufescens TaxID=6454 RepID=UPI00201F9126|nr:alkylated DNA repair protein alkB homolog 8-like [Haliotis rufescens]